MTKQGSSEKAQQVIQGLQDFIFISKYARWTPELKRRETWHEAVDRVRDMHLEKYNYLDPADKQEIIDAFQMVHDKKVLPSMRAMQFGGKAMLAHEARGYNCLAKETEFITSAGVKSFHDFQDGDNIQVLSHNGIWKNAVVRNFGTQKLYPVTVTRVKSSKIIWATKDHCWLLKDESRTNTVKEGDLLLGASSIFQDFDYDKSSVDERLYWAYGYVFGDGSKVKNEKGEYTTSLVRLCGEDKNRYLYRFQELGFSTSCPHSIKGDAFCYTGSYLKTAPNPEIDSPELIRAFVRGYLDADGAKSRSGNSKFYAIQSSDLDHIEFIRKCFPIAGVYIISERELTGQVTNYGTRPYTIWFNIFDVPQRKINSNNPFRVKSIGDNYREEDVWCLEVEDDHSFTLPNGLVTGNCSVRHVDSIRAFAEVAYLMLCGCGTGIGLSKHFLSRMPNLVNESDKTGAVITYSVDDTIEGWADSLEALLSCYFQNTCFSGRKIIFDYSKIRRKGSLLKTGGGRAPGYKPLKAAHAKIKKLLDRIIEEDHTVRIRPIHAYDILMFFADAVLSGGVRRTASSVIFDEDDEEMINAKTCFDVQKVRSSYDEETNTQHCKVWVNKHIYDVVFDLNKSFDKYEYEEQVLKNKKIGWFHIQPQRGRSNNSVLLLRDKITKDTVTNIIELTKMWGEPGFVFANHPWTLFNPCFEIGFIPVTEDGRCGVQFCNLTSLNGNLITCIDDFLKCVKAQTIIGTLQAGYTEFPYLSNACKELTEEEALLGNSMTGVLSNVDILLNENVLQDGAKLGLEINEIWAKKIFINPAARNNAEKPEGTGSLAIGVQEPGAHAAHSPEFYRRTQTTKGDNVYEFFKKHNPHMCEESVWNSNKTDDVITWPIHAKEGAMVKADLTALQHLKIIKTIQQNWVIPGTSKYNKKNVTNSVSCTVIVKNEEWPEVIDYIFDNKEYFAAVSFLSDMGDKSYQQAPYEKITTLEEYSNFYSLIDQYTPVDYTQLKESNDDTHHTAEASCAGGACLV